MSLIWSLVKGGLLALEDYVAHYSCEQRGGSKWLKTGIQS